MLRALSATTERGDHAAPSRRSAPGDRPPGTAIQGRREEDSNPMPEGTHRLATGLGAIAESLSKNGSRRCRSPHPKVRAGFGPVPVAGLVQLPSSRARSGNRPRDLQLTKQALFQLSYSGMRTEGVRIERHPLARTRRVPAGLGTIPIHPPAAICSRSCRSNVLSLRRRFFVAAALFSFQGLQNLQPALRAGGLCLLWCMTILRTPPSAARS